MDLDLTGAFCVVVGAVERDDEAIGCLAVPVTEGLTKDDVTEGFDNDDACVMEGLVA